jgi:hypothetical protein
VLFAPSTPMPDLKAGVTFQELCRDDVRNYELEAEAKTTSRKSIDKLRSSINLIVEVVGGDRSASSDSTAYSILCPGRRLVVFLGHTTV